MTRLFLGCAAVGLAFGIAAVSAQAGPPSKCLKYEVTKDGSKVCRLTSGGDGDAPSAYPQDHSGQGGSTSGGSAGGIYDRSTRQTSAAQCRSALHDAQQACARGSAAGRPSCMTRASRQYQACMANAV